MRTLLEQSLELPIPERIKLVEDIWDSISAEQNDQGTFELTPDQVAELERRIEFHRSHPEDTIPWETVRARALSRK